MPGVLGVVIGLVVVAALTFVVVLAWAFVVDSSPNEAVRLRIELDAARKQAAISAATTDTLTRLIQTAGRR